MYAKLIEHARQTGMRLQPNALRLASIGGAPVDPALKEKAEAMLGLQLTSGYGLTEAAPTVTRGGMALPGVELRIRDLQSGAQAAPGAVGALLVRGPNVMRGYYKDAAATAAAIDAQGWLDTGDLARLDTEGRLHIVGRVKEMIIRSGFNVYPAEVEAVLSSHKDVVQSAVVGRAADGNEEIVAFVQLLPGSRLTAEDLMNFTRSQLTSYKRPSEIVILEALPATATGKILKHKLAESLRGEGGESPPARTDERRRQQI
jgi:acyl-CoA synthetase (AMP-forming)/AMP-acid ligase II